MQLSSRTLQILKNFATINQSIVFKPGSQIKTMSTSKTILARADVDCTFDKNFAIYDLSRFLGAVSLFDNPVLETKDKYVEITSGSEHLNYVYSDPSLIVSPPDKDIKLPSEDVQFVLTSDVLLKTQKALGVIGAPEIAFAGDGKSVYMEAVNSRDLTSSNYRVRLGDTEKTFKFIILPENLKLLPGDYNVTLSAKGFSHFKGSDINYWVALEASSTYTG